MEEQLEIIDPQSLGRSPVHLSQAIATRDLVFVSGQVAFDETGQLVGQGDVEAQTRQVMSRVETALREAGSGLDQVVATTVYLKNTSDFAAFDKAWSEIFGDHRPTRATVSAGMVSPDFLVEVQAIAVRPAPTV